MSSFSQERQLDLPFQSLPTQVTFPWGDHSTLTDLSDLSPRESAYLGWVFSADQTKRQRAVEKLLRMRSSTSSRTSSRKQSSLPLFPRGQ